VFDGYFLQRATFANRAGGRLETAISNNTAVGQRAGH
jgi:hypothetical protein